MLIGIMWLIPKRSPRQKSIVLSVIMKDGNPVLTTRSPLINPNDAPTGSIRMNANSGSTPDIINFVYI